MFARFWVITIDIEKEEGNDCFALRRLDAADFVDDMVLPKWRVRPFGGLTLTPSLPRFAPDHDWTFACRVGSKLNRAGKPKLTAINGLRLSRSLRAGRPQFCARSNQFPPIPS
ncbi:hypothetical protein [Rhodopseudomonas sp.]|uniref:hypothetical protein n=1 Tax=Rhodopseudomonas sp. TaxID=1078 RepID=UPI0025CD7A06|nr:hypothetical protein [Rhodopseudomonas sp.]